MDAESNLCNARFGNTHDLHSLAEHIALFYIKRNARLKPFGGEHRSGSFYEFVAQVDFDRLESSGVVESDGESGIAHITAIHIECYIVICLRFCFNRGRLQRNLRACGLGCIDSDSDFTGLEISRAILYLRECNRHSRFRLKRSGVG